ncbi:MAG: glycosyltransferase, partial [Clostridium sp.]
CGIGVFAAYIGGIKVRISHAHTTSDSNVALIKKIYIWVMRSIIRLFSTKYLACSDNAGKYLFGNNIVNNKKYEKLPNYIDYDKFINCNSGSIREELGISEDDIVVGHVGRFIAAKNHKFIIDIIANMVQENNKVKCILVGNGDLDNEIRKKVKDLGLEEKIHFLGIRNDIEKIVKDLDLFILPSIYEGLGLVLLEAQSAGIPCLVSEAIQPEADLNIGLVSSLKLSDSVDVWTSKGLKMINIPKVEEEEILNSFIDRGYSIDNIVNKLEIIYGLDRCEERVSI